MRVQLLLMLLFCSVCCVLGRALDVCMRKPTINGLCGSSTLGIHYDVETQRCKYMGCSPDKKLFASLEDCDRICNSNKHRRRRIQYNPETPTPTQ